MGSEMNWYEYIPAVSFLIALIPFCISDWQTRTIPPRWFAPLLVLNIPALILYLQESPERNYYLLALTLGLCAILFAMSLIGSIGGADFIMASLLMIFVQYNPFKFPRVFFALDFFWTFMLMQVALVAGIFFYNVIHQNTPQEKTGFFKTMWHMGNTCPGYFTHAPNMIVIASAFVATLILEVLI